MVGAMEACAQLIRNGGGALLASAAYEEIDARGGRTLLEKSEVVCL